MLSLKVCFYVSLLLTGLVNSLPQSLHIDPNNDLPLDSSSNGPISTEDSSSNASPVWRLLANNQNVNNPSEKKSKSQNLSSNKDLSSYDLIYTSPSMKDFSVKAAPVWRSNAQGIDSNDDIDLSDDKSNQAISLLANAQCQLGNLPKKFPFEIEMNKGISWIPKGQCTEWADGRYYELTGKHAVFNGNANRWNELAQSKSGWEVSNTPTVPSIMVVEANMAGAGSVGHVAIVESITDGTICTSNWNAPTLGRTTFISKKAGSGISFIRWVGKV